MDVQEWKERKMRARRKKRVRKHADTRTVPTKVDISTWTEPRGTAAPAQPSTKEKQILRRWETHPDVAQFVPRYISGRTVWLPTRRGKVAEPCPNVGPIVGDEQRSSRTDEASGHRRLGWLPAGKRELVGNSERMSWNDLVQHGIVRED